MFRFAAKASVSFLLEIINTRTGGHSINNPTFSGGKGPERVAHNYFHLLQVLKVH
jgi:hypothetical protein